MESKAEKDFFQFDVAWLEDKERKREKNDRETSDNAQPKHHKNIKTTQNTTT